jgi:hypothetical protein
MLHEGYINVAQLPQIHPSPHLPHPPLPADQPRDFCLTLFRHTPYFMPLLPSIHTPYHLTTSAVPTSRVYTCRIHKLKVVITCLTNMHHLPDFSFADPV